MNGPLYKNTDSGGGMAATRSFWSCLAAPRPGGEEGREHPLAAVGYSPTPQQTGLGSEPPQRGEGRASSHPAICPPAPSPGACGCLLFQGTGGQCCLQARGGLGRCRAQVCTHLVSSRPQGERHGLFVAWGSLFCVAPRHSGPF